MTATDTTPQPAPPHTPHDAHAPARSTSVNGVDTAALAAFAATVRERPTAGAVRFTVASRWAGGARSTAHVGGYTLGRIDHTRDFVIVADEPPQLLGTDTAPNPQELLLAALNACLIVGYAATAAAMGVILDALEIRAEGTLDLRGFLGLDPTVNPGYDDLRYVVTVRSAAPEARLREVHARVIATSPNFANLSRAVALHPTLHVERQAPSAPATPDV